MSVEADGLSINFANDVDIAADGTIYFSDSSSEASLAEALTEITEQPGPYGRLLAYDPETKTTQTVLDGLWFANGVAVSPDQSFVLVNELTGSRVTRYWLTEPKQGESDIFIDNLPGYPDGISSNGKDMYWLALVLGGTVLGLDMDGNVVHNLKLLFPSGEPYEAVTSVQEHEGMLYLGHLNDDAIGCLALEEIAAVEALEANKAMVSRFIEEGLTQANPDAFDELVAPDFIHYVAGKVEIEGIEAYKEFITMLHTAFDLKFLPEDMFAEGDKVVVRTTYSGTHQGEFHGIAPTGKDVVFTGICIFRIADDKIAEIWTEYDVLGLMQQLGVIPPDREDYTWGVPSEVTGDPGDPETNKDITLRVVDLWNTGNLAIADEIFATNFVNYDPVHPWVSDIESYKQFVAMCRIEWPDHHVTIEDMVAEGDKIACRWTTTATHEGGAFGIPKTGKQMTWTGMTIYRFVDGKIVESWWCMDALGIQQQFGLIPPLVKDFSNVFFMPLAPGLNMISLPLEPQTPYTARSFAEKLSATTVIKLDGARQRFVGFTLDAPDDGFAVEGGKGYIVNVPEGGMVAFTGAAWTRPPMPAPEVRDFDYPAQTDGAWAFVVSGRFFDDSDDSLKRDGYLVTIRNPRMNVVATDVVRSGYFAAAFADLSRKNVVQTGDRLELTLRNRAGEIVSDTLTYTVTADTIRQAFLPIILKNVEIPRQSMLLPNYPNPFNPETWIPYQIRESADVVIRIYSANGQLVRTLDLGQRAAGFYLGRTRAAHWDGHNDAGEHVASGIYFYQLQAGDFSSTRRMLVLK